MLESMPVPFLAATGHDCRRRAARLQTAIALALATAGALTACGGSTPTTAASHSTSSAQPARRPPKKTPAGKPRVRHRRPPPVGTTQRVRAGDSTLSVTVTKVIDPLRDSGAALLPGTRAVGVVVTIRDDGGATYDSTASGDVSVVGSSGPAAPLFIRQGVCETPLTDFESLIAVGTAHSGCVGFTLAGNTGIRAVRFSPHSRAPGTVLWR
jgi:hypothetical protein